MGASFDEALEIARRKYPHPINRYEEYEGYFVFYRDDGDEHVGGEFSPIVIRKSDSEALNYAPVFFDLDPDAEDVGDVLSEGEVCAPTGRGKAL